MGLLKKDIATTTVWNVEDHVTRQREPTKPVVVKKVSFHGLPDLEEAQSEESNNATSPTKCLFPTDDDSSLNTTHSSLREVVILLIRYLFCVLWNCADEWVDLILKTYTARCLGRNITPPRQ